MALKLSMSFYVGAFDAESIIKLLPDVRLIKGEWKLIITFINTNQINYSGLIYASKITLRFYEQRKKKFQCEKIIQKVKNC